MTTNKRQQDVERKADQAVNIHHELDALCRNVGVGSLEDANSEVDELRCRLETALDRIDRLEKTVEEMTRAKATKEE